MVEQDKCRENQKNGSRFGSRGMSDRRLSPLIEYPEYQNAEYDLANMPAPTAIMPCGCIDASMNGSTLFCLGIAGL